MANEARARRARTPEIPVIPDIIKPLAELPLSTRKAIWQTIDDLEATSGGGPSCGRQAVAKVIRDALTLIREIERGKS